MSETLSVEARQDHGKHPIRRLRLRGAVPAILYGQGADNLSLSIPADQVAAVVRHGARLVELKGAVNEKAFVRALQWDVYGKTVLHMDLTRISEDQTVRVKVVVELRGAAVGVKEGGVLDHRLHELDIECRVLAIPDKIQVNVNDLHLNHAIKVGELHLPEGVKVFVDEDEIVVQCVPPREESDAAPGEGGSAEPELIGRKPDEEGEEAE